MGLLKVIDLVAGYRRPGAADRNVLRRVTFSVEGGQTLVVLGPNGSGKSTLLHAIAGSLDGTVAGDVEVLGRSILSEPRHRRAGRVAMVHQDPARGTAAHLTLREHCDLTKATEGRRRVTWQQVQDRLDSLGTALEPWRLAGELSGGQRQLFTLLLAVLSEPTLLLLDEPTSALDARHAAIVLDVLRHFSGPNTASILVTHDLAEASSVGDRLLVLNARGEVQSLFDGSAKANLDPAALRGVLTEAAAAAWAPRA